MLPDPFNSVAELSLWSGFLQGDSNGQNSVLEGTFAFVQFETALAEARREIYRKTLRKQNDEFDEDRRDELKEAERWLAIARLWPNFGARMALKFPESNAQGTGEVFSGPDTPAPLEKSRQYVEFMYQRLRRIGLELLESPSTRFAISIGTPNEAIDPYRCLAPGVFSSDQTCNQCEVL